MRNEVLSITGTGYWLLVTGFWAQYTGLGEFYFFKPAIFLVSYNHLHTKPEELSRNMKKFFSSIERSHNQHPGTSIQ